MRNKVHSSSLLVAVSFVGILLLGKTIWIVQASQDEEKQTNGMLRNIYDEYMSAKGVEPEADQSSVSTPLLDAFSWNKDKSAILVEVTPAADYEGAVELLKTAFDDFDFDVTGCSKHRCCGYLPIEKFPEFEARDEVRAIRPSVSVSEQAGSVVSEALQALRIDLVRQADATLTGSGLKIGILSDSFNTLGGLSDDQDSGDLPLAGVTIIKELSRLGSDEGRAMAQLVHDLIPGAEILFYTAFEGADDFASGITALANAGCNVIVDDVVNLLEPFFQDGVIAQSANDVAEGRGVPYFSSVGNAGKFSWEGTFSGSGVSDAKGCEIHEFSPGVTRQRVEIRPGTSRFSFQWEDPFFSVSGSPGASLDMDVRIYNSDGTLRTQDISIETGNDPAVLLFVTNSFSFTNIEVELEFSLCTTVATSPRMKWIGFSNIVDIVDFDTQSSTSFGHKNQRFTAAVGASFFQETPAFGIDPPLLESFSSRGGTPVLFERDGSRKPTDEIRNQPRFVAPDRCINTFFGSFTSYSPNGFGYYFAGTSAAAPNAAAVAILLLQVNPTLTPAQIYSILENTAINMDVAGFDFDSGYGLIDGEAAVNAAIAQAGTMQPSTSPSITPSSLPFASPSDLPSVSPSSIPSLSPTEGIDILPPVAFPTALPSFEPSIVPSSAPSNTPSYTPSKLQSSEPSGSPSSEPSIVPSNEPSNTPSERRPSSEPSNSPSISNAPSINLLPDNPPTPRPTRRWIWGPPPAKPLKPSPTNWGPSRPIKGTPTKKGPWWLRPNNNKWYRRRYNKGRKYRRKGGRRYYTG